MKNLKVWHDFATDLGSLIETGPEICYKWKINNFLSNQADIQVILSTHDLHFINNQPILS